jgi:ethanolamine utilization protein EutN/carbon dioxide concentrating mechanism protein CcmL
MQLARVIGSVVSTRKSERLEGLKLLVAVPVDMDTFEEKGAPFVTVDTVGAGEGEIVMWAGGSSSRQTELTGSKPVDSSIIGIVDFVDILGKRVYSKHGREAAEDAP